jgi:hypothetical protein
VDKEPLVSAFYPAQNHEKFLAEYLIQDGAYSDNTPNIIKKF